MHQIYKKNHLILQFALKDCGEGSAEDHVTAATEVSAHQLMDHVTAIQGGWETAVRRVSPC